MTAEEYLRQKYGAHRGYYEWRALEEAFNAGAAAEREECAKVCEGMPQYIGSKNERLESSAKACGAAIRARGGKE